MVDRKIGRDGDEFFNSSNWHSPCSKIEEGEFQFAHRDVQHQPNSFAHGKPNLRKMIELPYHQIKGRLSEKFDNTFFSLDFIKAKIEAGLFTQLLEDYELALKECPSWCSYEIVQKLQHFFEFVKKEVCCTSLFSVPLFTLFSLCFRLMNWRNTIFLCS